MDHLENIFPPAVLNSLHVDVVAISVVRGHVRERDLDLTGVIEADKVDDHICELWPLLKLPLHLDLSVIAQLLVDALDGPIKHL